MRCQLERSSKLAVCAPRKLRLKVLVAANEMSQAQRRPPPICVAACEKPPIPQASSEKDQLDSLG
eukprot:5691277-Heterocapsa_arctica.AAC.1